ncbi:hypothetical protein T439DRAFT_219639 [Meredithblackwellia eburnea MCA 4105]
MCHHRFELFMSICFVSTSCLPVSLHNVPVPVISPLRSPSDKLPVPLSKIIWAPLQLLQPRPSSRQLPHWPGPKRVASRPLVQEVLGPVSRVLRHLLPLRQLSHQENLPIREPSQEVSWEEWSASP